MRFRFRKSIKVAPGIRINLSKSGASTTIGGKGASINIGKNGTFLNTSIPGTGLYSRERISGNSGAKEGAVNYIENQIDTEYKTTHSLLSHILFGIATLGAVAGGKEAAGVTVLVAVILAFRFISHITRKTKPIYEQKPLYKADRRYKTGQRIDGYHKVKNGSEPLSKEEIQQHKYTAYIRGVYAIALWSSFVWQLMNQ